MSESLIPREEAAARFSVAKSVLIRYEARGLVQAETVGGREGYRPAQIRRLWSVLSLQRDLGVNLAGVEAILRLEAQVDQLQRRLVHLANELNDALEADLARDADAEDE